ncbi:unnamed protein product, partial [Gulo gulo]
SDLCAAGLGHYWEALVSQEVGSALVTRVPPKCKIVSLNDSPKKPSGPHFYVTSDPQESSFSVNLWKSL